MSFFDFVVNVRDNLFQPLLLFFYLGVCIPLFRVGFEFPHQVYQGIVVFLLVSIGWHGGEELAKLSGDELAHAGGFMVVGFVTNFVIGIVAYGILRLVTRLRKIDAATVAAYYGSDSAGTFATCIGVLGTLQMAALTGALTAPITLDSLGLEKNLSFKQIVEASKDPKVVERWNSNGTNVAQITAAIAKGQDYVEAPYMPVMLAIMEIPGCLVGLYLVARLRRTGMDKLGNMPGEAGYNPAADGVAIDGDRHESHSSPPVSVEPSDHPSPHKKGHSIFSADLLHEVFLNAGIYLLIGAIVVGYISELQGVSAVAKFDKFFLDMFYGVLCLYLLEMGITAAKRFGDLRIAGWRFILFGLAVPNLFAIFGIVIAHAYSHVSGSHFSTGTYMVFAVLCAAASYIAVPAIQRLAIPEASPTLPLAASLGLTFAYNVTFGITMYQLIALWLKEHLPVALN